MKLRVSTTSFHVIMDISKFEQYMLCYFVCYYSILIMLHMYNMHILKLWTNGVDIWRYITTFHEAIAISKYEVDGRLSVNCNYIVKFSILHASCRIKMHLTNILQFRFSLWNIWINIVWGFLFLCRVYWLLNRV